MNEQKKIKVWDPLIRLFHWSLVAAFVIAYSTEDDWMMVHSWAGYLIGVLLLFRLAWGFIGPRFARFSDFIRPVAEVKTYLKEMSVLQAKRHIGHNPAGGAMIIALLLSLMITVVTGLGAYGVEGAGPMAAWFSGVGQFGWKMLEEVHEFFANFTLLLVVVHVAGVMVGTLVHNENLVRAMVTGWKRAEDDTVEEWKAGNAGLHGGRLER
ncbi:MAG: cytochrome b/b6 domain-containing protein [gamma proteobacterium endosymbiont of Lamellibrachia anaximandri]|nr:cytochrome b/b6 domain-containing protein [gamma proteobacterium endosymbiont of Lamellibrachia anaximandri]MBL3616194.1 cytochrome b/b6 domain-containing protein [gamma proteobacterium endosymbiont of Lamellibrachia anaximandri]